MIRQDIEIFMRDCRSRSLSHHTVVYYRRQLVFFQVYCESQGVLHTENITADLLRQYLISLEGEHNAGGKHARYRAVKVFMLWFEREMEPANWSNPIHKVKPPKVSKEPIEGASIEQIRKLIDTCDGSFLGLRDKAILMFLLDSGVRLQELLDLNMNKVLDSGAFVLNMLRSGKVDVFSLKLLTGHTSLDVLGRYAAKVSEDAQKAHEDGSPVERLL